MSNLNYRLVSSLENKITCPATTEPMPRATAAAGEIAKQVRRSRRQGHSPSLALARTRVPPWHIVTHHHSPPHPSKRRWEWSPLIPRCAEESAKLPPHSPSSPFKFRHSIHDSTSSSHEMTRNNFIPIIAFTSYFLGAYSTRIFIVLGLLIGMSFIQIPLLTKWKIQNSCN